MERAHWAALLAVCALSSAYAWRNRTHRPIAVYLLTLALCDALRASGLVTGGLDLLAFLVPPVALLAAIAVVLRSGAAGVFAFALGAVMLNEVIAGDVSSSVNYSAETVAVLAIGGGGLVWEMRKGRR